MADRVAANVFDVVGEVEAYRRQIDDALARLGENELTSFASQAPKVAAAIRYSLLGGGKRFRGILLLASYRAAGGVDDATLMASAVEIVHAYSLVHDDLPCMDDDDVRRGRPSVHRKFDTRVATVAGLVMVPLAVRTAAHAAFDLCPRNADRVVRELMSASGAGGMIGGQMLDLEGEGKKLSLSELEQIHSAKTGALVSTAALLGGLVAGATSEAAEALAQYGSALGLAFQIIDDVLDVTATTEDLGKTAGRDAILGKSTYPALLGVEGAMRRGDALIDQGCTALSTVGLLTPLLESIARFVVRRRA